MTFGNLTGNLDSALKPADHKATSSWLVFNKEFEDGAPEVSSKDEATFGRIAIVEKEEPRQDLKPAKVEKRAKDKTKKVEKQEDKKLTDDKATQTHNTIADVGGQASLWMLITSGPHSHKPARAAKQEDAVREGTGYQRPFECALGHASVPWISVAASGFEFTWKAARPGTTSAEDASAPKSAYSGFGESPVAGTVGEASSAVAYLSFDPSRQGSPLTAGSGEPWLVTADETGRRSASTHEDAAWQAHVNSKPLAELTPLSQVSTPEDDNNVTDGDMDHLNFGDQCSGGKEAPSAKASSEDASRLIAGAGQPCWGPAPAREWGREPPTPAIPGKVPRNQKGHSGRWRGNTPQGVTEVIEGVEIGHTYPKQKTVFPAAPSNPFGNGVVITNSADNEIPKLHGETLEWHTMEAPKSHTRIPDDLQESIWEADKIPQETR